VASVCSIWRVPAGANTENARMLDPSTQLMDPSIHMIAPSSAPGVVRQLWVGNI